MTLGLPNGFFRMAFFFFVSTSIIVLCPIIIRNVKTEDMALIFGEFDKAIPGSEKEIAGKYFPPKLQKRPLDLYDEITVDMEYFFCLLTSFTDKGGLTPGGIGVIQD